ncbi:MAG: hypothetical protein NTW86_10465 [Candidatus Sumerlaeota bacterium]|nr:hypothetical protein [Candidatus Sumerlaeota bacterium]
MIRFIPELNADREKRRLAQAFAERERSDNGRYCFSAGIAELSRMLESGQWEILFRTLNYKTPAKATTSFGQILPSKTPALRRRHEPHHRFHRERDPRGHETTRHQHDRPQRKPRRETTRACNQA